jgi:Kef-type K+ transport system membrane component KefB
MTTNRVQTPRWMVWTRRALVVAGILAIGSSAVGVLRAMDLTREPYLRYFVVALIADDLLVFPLALLVGALVVRFLPAWARPVVQGALFVSAAVTIVAIPAVLGYGRSNQLPSALPRDYGRGLLITYAAIWLVAVVLLVVRVLREGAAHDERAPSRDGTKPPEA